MRIKYRLPFNVYVLIPAITALLALAACKDPVRSIEDGIELFSEYQRNEGEEIKTFGGILFALGWRESNEDGKNTLNTLVVLDTNLKMLWMKNYGYADTDYALNESFDSFEIDERGNIYMAGGGSKPALQKCNASGDVLWKKEYDLGSGRSRFTKIVRKGQDLLLLVYGDSTEFCKIDSSGALLWSMSLRADLPGKSIAFLGTKNFATTQGLAEYGFPELVTTVYCIADSGAILWRKEINSSMTQINGANLMNIAADRPREKILLHYRSGNQFVADVSLVSIDTGGVTTLLLHQNDPQFVPCEHMREVVLCYDQYSSAVDYRPKAVVTLRNDVYAFCEPPYPYLLKGFTEIDGVKYFIGTKIADTGTYSDELNRSWVIIKK